MHLDTVTAKKAPPLPTASSMSHTHWESPLSGSQDGQAASGAPALPSKLGWRRKGDLRARGQGRVSSTREKVDTKGGGRAEGGAS